MQLNKFTAIALAFLFSLSMSACSKDSEHAAEDKGYIPEPSAPVSVQESPSENVADSQAEDVQPAENSAAGSETASTEQHENADKTENSEKDVEAETSPAVAGTSAGNQSNSVVQADEAVDEKSESSVSEANSASRNAAEAAENSSSEDKSEEKAPVDSSSHENTGSKGENGAAEAKTAAAEAENASKNDISEASVQNSPAAEAAFGSCGNLYSSLEKCEPFKCSVASSFLGKTIDDTYEVKGMRSGKCRYVTGIYMKEKNKISESANLVCNFTEGERKKAAAYVKDTKNLKSSLITGINGEDADLKNNPFVKFFADNSCVKACKKYQTETEKIELLENGRFITIRVRCPSED